MFSEKYKSMIETDFQKVMQTLDHKEAEQIRAQLNTEPNEIMIAMKYFYSVMPLSDLYNYSYEIFRAYAEHGIFLRKTIPYVASLKEELFFPYVLFYRINNEEILPCRELFYRHMKDVLLMDGSCEDILKTNLWCAKQVSYRCTDDRTISPLYAYYGGVGRCGEESTFAVSVLRSVGIPARQVYAPYWAHCDDNHAWVEVWCNHKWNFLGACEPEAQLDKGWFNGAASRAMMVHSRVFRNQLVTTEDMKYHGTYIGREGKTQLFSQLSRYANTRKIEVTLLTADKTPAIGEEVKFQLINYCHFVTLAKRVTDQNGRAELFTGHGTVLVCAGTGKKYTESLVSLTGDQSVILTLSKGPKKNCWEAIDFIAPLDQEKEIRNLSSDVIKEFFKKKIQAEQSYQRKMKNLPQTEVVAYLTSNDGTFDAKVKRELLSFLRPKDLIDTKVCVLQEHIRMSLPYQSYYKPELFYQYLLNPRIENEILSTYRREILSLLSEEEVALFRENPKEIYVFVKRNIKSDPFSDQKDLITKPASCLKNKVGNEKSQRILTVAICRSLGIPARLNKRDGAIEYYREGEFHLLEENRERISVLTMISGAKNDWNCKKDWGLEREEVDGYTSLDFTDETFENGRLSLSLVPGNYRLIVVNRLLNGNIYANRIYFNLVARQVRELTLTNREADLRENLVEVTLPEIKVLNSMKNVLELRKVITGQASILMLLKEGKEPTEHILNEIMEDGLQNRSLYKIVFLVSGPKACKQETLASCLKKNPEIEVYYADLKAVGDKLARKLYTTPEKFPLLIVCNRRGQGVMALAGYQVGSFECLKKVVQILS